jgi:hypothetical protein
MVMLYFILVNVFQPILCVFPSLWNNHMFIIDFVFQGNCLRMKESVSLWCGPQSVHTSLIELCSQ